MALASPGFLLWKTSSISTSTQYREISESSSSDVIAIKEVIHAQQQLLQKLYAELDEEREASSSAATEAMSMIIRLQEDKSRLKPVHKRGGGEDVHRSPSSKSEIASLEFQIQAYKAKLLEMGYIDLNLPDCDFTDSPQR